MSDKNLTNINQKVERLEGYEGPGFLATTLDKAVGLARKNSLWPLPFATSWLPWHRTMIWQDLVQSV